MLKRAAAAAAEPTTAAAAAGGVDWVGWAQVFLKARLPRDEPCAHEKVSRILKQTRCGDEIETSIITCLYCGKQERRS